MLRCLTRPTTVLITGRPSSTSIQIGVTWGDPSRLMVPRWAKFVPFQEFLGLLAEIRHARCSVDDCL